MLDYNTLNGFIGRIKNKLSFKGKDTLKVDGKLMVDDATKLVDKDGNALIPDSSKVIANPSIEQGVPLETIDIDGVGYTIQSGGGSVTLYQHHIDIYQEDPYNEICLNIVTSSNTRFTISTLLQYIANKGAEYGEDKVISCTGKVTRTNVEYSVYGILSNGQLLIIGTSGQVTISDQTYSIYDTTTSI